MFLYLGLLHLKGSIKKTRQTREAGYSVILKMACNMSNKN